MAQNPRQGHRTNALGSALLVLLAALAASAPARALIEPAHNAYLEIPRPWTGPAIHLSAPGDGEKSVAIAAECGRIERELGDRYGQAWRVLSWNDRTGTPHAVCGSSPRLAAGLAGSGDWEVLGRSILSQNRAALGVDPERLHLADVRTAAGRTVLHYRQMHGAAEVLDAAVKLAFDAEGRLVMMSSDYHGAVGADVAPVLGEQAAIEVAERAFTAAAGVRPAGEAELLVLPLTAAGGGLDYRLSWRVRVRTDNPVGIWVTYVDAHDGTVLWRYNDVRFLFEGDTSSLVQPNTYCDGTAVRPVPHLYLNHDDPAYAVTDSTGSWSIDTGGGELPVSCSLRGPYIWVNANGAGPLASWTGTAVDGVPLTIAFDETNSQYDERNVFDAINNVRAFYRTFAPDFRFVDFQMGAEVSIADYCNAYWDGDLHFFQAGGPCVNTGELQDVIYHEYGHGVSDFVLGQQQGYEGCAEGNSDVLAILMTNDPVIARGIVAGDCTGGIRNADNTLVYPDDVIGHSEHEASQVISGFHWDALQALRARYGPEEGTRIAARDWHYGRWLWRPLTPPDQVLATILANDDDGDLTNGTPDLDIYSAAALAHGFTPPSGVVITHRPLQDTTNTEIPHRVLAEIRSTGAAIDEPTVSLYWRHDDGDWQQTPMVRLNPAGDQFEGWIPSQDYGTVGYHISAKDAVGNGATYPAAGASSPLEFQVAWEIYTAEWVGGWQVGAPGDLATQGLWELVNPTGVPGQSEDDHTPDGECAWITGQYTEGDFWATDVDGGCTTLRSAYYNLEGAESVEIRYWKWFSNDQGAYPGTDPWRVYLSNDMGMNWTMVENTTQSSDGWEEVVLDLGTWFETPGIVRLQFEAWDIYGDSQVEAGVDDFCIVARWPSRTGAEEVPPTRETALLGAAPNPFNPSTRIRFVLGADGPARVTVFDAAGRRVRTVLDESLSAGPHAVTWDGRDEADRSCASGVYFSLLESGGRTFSRRMVLLK